MPDTAEHRADMYALGQQRRAAGLPMWDRKISVAGVFHNDAMTFPERRDAIVRRLRASTWFKSKNECDDLPMFVEELSAAQNVDDFNSAWDAIYDEADYDRVWITTR